jgi:16S rRNA (cytosine1402-N4)-methyltransferase
MTVNEGQHIPVLKEAVCTAFKEVQGWILDATFGGGGHAMALLDTYPHISIVAVDRDFEAAERAEAFASYGGRFRFVNDNFSNIASLGQRFEGVLFDLGVSSFQLDRPCRGFSFRHEGPLDMRMGREGRTAEEFLENASDDELAEAIRDFGEERNWRRILRHVVAGRGQKNFATTTDFVHYIEPVLDRRRTKIHPATRVFQGVRMAVNRELDHLRRALPLAFEALDPGGVLVVIDFHSLEDRVVKRHFNFWAGKSVDRDDSTPQQSRIPEAKLVSSKPIRPDPKELFTNPRCRSAKLRILRKLP